MCDSRLGNIAVLSVKSPRARSIDFDAFVDESDARHHKRKLSLHSVIGVVRCQYCFESVCV